SGPEMKASVQTLGSIGTIALMWWPIQGATAQTATAAILLLGATPADAHRLDEYLQATTISVGKDRVRAQIRLTRGVAVFPGVLADIDTDADGVISYAERRAYAKQVFRDLSLAIDGTRLTLQLPRRSSRASQR
ncbi:MAG: hypothetical protein ABI877_10495, partial [Gemmatimonadaceae bacterium]